MSNYFLTGLKYNIVSIIVGVIMIAIFFAAFLPVLAGSGSGSEATGAGFLIMGAGFLGLLVIGLFGQGWLSRTLWGWDAEKGSGLLRSLITTIKFWLVGIPIAIVTRIISEVLNVGYRTVLQEQAPSPEALAESIQTAASSGDMSAVTSMEALPLLFGVLLLSFVINLFVTGAIVQKVWKWH